MARNRISVLQREVWSWKCTTGGCLVGDPPIAKIFISLFWGFVRKSISLFWITVFEGYRYGTKPDLSLIERCQQMKYITGGSGGSPLRQKNISLFWGFDQGQAEILSQTVLEGYRMWDWWEPHLLDFFYSFFLRRHIIVHFAAPFAKILYPFFGGSIRVHLRS